MSAELHPPTAELLPIPTPEITESLAGPLTRFREKLGKALGATLLVAGTSVTAFTANEVANPAVAEAAFDANTGNYPWHDAAHVPQPPAEDPLTWGYTDKQTCDDKSAAFDCGTYKRGSFFVRDAWGADLRNCTSYAAWRVATEYGVNPIDMGSGKDWDDRAAGKGWTVRAANATPEVGDVAVWNATTKNKWGHVAFVEEVKSDGSVRIAEYNRRLDGKFSNTRVIKADSYIDINGPNPANFKLKVGPDDGQPPASPPVTVDKTQVILNHAGEVWARDTVGNQGWVQETDADSAVDVASGGNVQMLLDYAGQVWAQDGIGRDWVRENDPASAVEIEVGSDGTQMLRDHSSAIYAKKGVGWGGWIPIAGPGSAKDIETNGGVMILRNYADQLWIYSGAIGSGYWYPASNEYDIREAEVSKDGSIMVRNYADEIWTRKTGGWVNEAGPGSAAQIAANGGLRVVLNHAGELWYKGGDPGWGGFQLEAGYGSAKQIEVMDDGTQVLLDYSDKVYARGTGAGNDWVPETGPGAAKMIAD